MVDKRAFAIARSLAALVAMAAALERDRAALVVATTERQTKERADLLASEVDRYRRLDWIAHHVVNSPPDQGAATTFSRLSRPAWPAANGRPANRNRTTRQC
jgi:hypothetical protein